MIVSVNKLFMYRTAFVYFVFVFFSFRPFTPTVPGMCKWKPVKMCFSCLSLFFYLSVCHKTIWEMLIRLAWHLTFWCFTKIFSLLQFWLNSDNKVRYFTWRHLWNCVCLSSVMCDKLTRCNQNGLDRQIEHDFCAEYFFSFCITGFEITDWAGFFMFCQLVAWTWWGWFHCCSRVHLFMLFVTMSNCNTHRFKMGSSNNANLPELLHIAYIYNSLIM